MEFWIDTATSKTVCQANHLGILSGVTTNPTILSKSKKNPIELINDLLISQDGPVAVQVLSLGEKERINEAMKIKNLSSKTIVKIPVDIEGVPVIARLAKEKVPVLATAIFSLEQALLAFQAGADYLAPYLGRFEERGGNIQKLLEEMMLLKHNYGFKGKIMAAGVRQLEVVSLCAKIGIDAITLPENLFFKLFENHPATTQALDDFSRAWTQAYPNFSL